MELALRKGLNIRDTETHVCTDLLPATPPLLTVGLRGPFLLHFIGQHHPVLLISSCFPCRAVNSWGRDGLPQVSSWEGEETHAPRQGARRHGRAPHSQGETEAAEGRVPIPGPMRSIPHAGDWAAGRQLGNESLGPGKPSAVSTSLSKSCSPNT